MTWDLLLAIGILLSNATQLRPGDAPVGPGEVCLAIWIVLMLGRETARLGPRFTPALSRLVIFWLLFAAAQSIGILTSYFIADPHDTKALIHDLTAYPLLAAVCVLSVVGPNAGSRVHRVAWLLVTLGSVELGLQALQAWNFISIGTLDLWFWERMRGWSDNPNQLAFQCAMLALLCLHLADVAASVSARIGAVGASVLPIYVGLLTRSDTFGIILIVAGPIFLAIKLRTWLLLHQRTLSARSAFAWIAVLTLPLLLGTVAQYGSSLAANVRGLAEDVGKGDQQDSDKTAHIRLHVWRSAFSRGLDAGMLGLGPGPHVPVPPSIAADRRDPAQDFSGGPQLDPADHAAPNGTPNFEAHDTLLDIFTQGGLLAVLTLVWLVATAFLQTYRTRLDGLTTLLCGLTIFSTFHLVIRHPIFWFSIATALTAAEGRTLSLKRRWS
jgi:hypothetical protein